MNNLNPLVTICIPTYNNEKYLNKCLESIRAQTYQNVEVIISDNLSNDGTLEIIKYFCRQSNWSYIVNKKNIGALSNFNKLISMAKGDLIAIYHSDDYYHPKIIETCVKCFVENNSVHLVGTMANIVDGNDNIISKYTLSKLNQEERGNCYNFEDCLIGVVSGSQLSEYEISQFFITPSIMVRKSAYDLLGGFVSDSLYGSAADYEMWLRIASTYNVAIIEQQLMSYRVHLDQGSQHEIRENINIPDIINVISQYKKKLKHKEMIFKCDKFINKILLGTALKQNNLNLFSTSQDTLKHVFGTKYYIYKVALKLCNLMKFNATFAVCTKINK